MSKFFILPWPLVIYHVEFSFKMLANLFRMVGRAECLINYLKNRIQVTASLTRSTQVRITCPRLTFFDNCERTC